MRNAIERPCRKWPLILILVGLAGSPLVASIALAEIKEFDEGRTRQEQILMRFAQGSGVVADGDPNVALDALIKQDEKRRAKEKAANESLSKIEKPSLTEPAESAAQGEMAVLSAAAKAEKGKAAPIPAVDEETLSLYPTAAQCGECHKQIYDEWPSSQHAYTSI